MKLKILLASATLFLFIPTLFAGQVYKWVDDNGQIHYSDKKPNHIDSTSMRVSGGKQTSTRTSAQEKSSTLEEQKQKELEKKAEALKASSAKKENDSRCQAIRDNLKKITENSRVRIEENGELRYLSPEELEERKGRYADQLSKHCQ